MYREVFETIAREDLEFSDDPEKDIYPSFGKSVSAYDEVIYPLAFFQLVVKAMQYCSDRFQVVGTFYGFWESYCTKKSYVWAEKYDTREAPNRQVRRLMEQDNRKLREKARKERNEQVRVSSCDVAKREVFNSTIFSRFQTLTFTLQALVAFVKKRDKRVQEQKVK